MPRILLLATTTGYQTRSFGDAAERLGVELVFATDRCHVLDDPWRDRAIPIRFHEEAASADAIADYARTHPIDGLLVVGDRPTVIAALAAERLGLPGNPPAAAAASRNKRLLREHLRAASLPAPWFTSVSLDSNPSAVSASLRYPCVLKPIALSGSRGVIRADDSAGFVRAFGRLRALVGAPDVRAERNRAHDTAIVEGFIPGREYAVEAILNAGTLRVLAIFDKPDPLDGPFFEETIYVTPSRAGSDVQDAIERAIVVAAGAIGLRHGAVHAECRVNDEGVFVLEVAARPIGGLCARALRFARRGADLAISLEELLMRQALGEPVDGWAREPLAAGVMMIPIPARGIFRGASGVDAARAMPAVEDVRITAKPDQLLVPLPEGASYLGFIFARGDRPDAVERALRDAHACLRFAVDPELPVVQSAHG
jgi:biotin carboxylase